MMCLTMQWAHDAMSSGDSIHAACQVLSYMPTYPGAKLRRIESVEQMTLYDVNTLLILPATEGRQCSFVEIVANEATSPPVVVTPVSRRVFLWLLISASCLPQAQTPDYFISHWWGEPIVQFVACLQQHSKDRGLEDKEGWYEGEEMNPHPLYLGGRPANYWVSL